MITRTIRQFTPECMLGAPRRSSAIPSPDGKLAVYTSQTYSFDSHSKSAEICVVDVATGVSTVLSTDVHASSPQWLGDGHQLVWLKEGSNSNTSLVVADARAAGKCYVAGTISGPVSDLKICHLQDGMVALAVAGQANPDGSLHNPKDAPKVNSTALVYDSIFVRHWDHWLMKQRNSIFTALLQRAPARVSDREGRYNLVGFTNALAGTRLESPIPPMGGTDHFDIGPKGIVFVAKDPELVPALHTKCNAYFVPRKSLMDLSIIEPVKLEISGFDGAATSPSFAPNGTSVAFLQMREDKYEADQNHILFFHGLGSGKCSASALKIIGEDGAGWDLSPSSLVWSSDGTKIYMIVNTRATNSLYELSLTDRDTSEARQLTHEGTVTDALPLSKTSPHLLITRTSLTTNNQYAILNPAAQSASLTALSPSLSAETMFGLHRRQVRSLWWKGDKDHPVHALMMVPSTFRPDHKYPLAYLVHGGPQGAWNDAWSTRWNPAVYAEQGYVVVCPNPTGSTGYGQAFTDAIQCNWGGSPYIDLEKGFEYIKTELDFVDTDRAVALGASFGGYMMNWIQGQPLGKKFKAMVCHDGGFSTVGQLGSEEQYFDIHDMGGTYWERRDLWEKWDPSRFLEHWSTPMLVIHSDRDYRVLIADGLSSFNVLQTKGIESRFLAFPDENHWVLKHENSLVWHLVVLNWINKFVGLPKVVDKDGNDGEQYLQEPKK